MAAACLGKLWLIQDCLTIKAKLGKDLTVMQTALKLPTHKTLTLDFLVR